VTACIIVLTKVERVAPPNAASVDVKKRKAGSGGHSHGQDVDY
jgi:hypothetical protein